MTEPSMPDDYNRPLILVLGGLALFAILGTGIFFGYRYFFGGPAVSNLPYAAESACDHPYLPLRPGAVWRYRGEVVIDENDPVSTVVTWRVENVLGDQKGAVAVVIVEYDYEDGEVIIRETVEYTCSQDGLRQSNSIVGGGAQSINQFVNPEGVYIPTQEIMENRGSNWRHQYTVISNFEPPGSDYDWEYEVTAFEMLDGLPDDLEAVKVEGTRAQTVNAEEIITEEWFSFGVGQVRSQRTQRRGDSVLYSELLLAQMTLP